MSGSQLYVDLEAAKALPFFQLPESAASAHQCAVILAAMPLNRPKRGSMLDP
jgi:hypothetical protein